MGNDSTLSSILPEVDSLLTKLLELSKKKADALLNHDIQALGSIVSDEERAVERLRHLGEGIPALLEDAGSEQALVAIRQKSRLLREANMMNQALLRQSLKLVQYELSLLRPQNGYAGYARTGPLLVDIRT